MRSERCIKCGSQEGFSGPFYQRPAYQPERLRYYCIKCGWEYFTPCEDAPKKEKRDE